MKEFLTPVQFGKFLLFERSFSRQVRDAMDEISRGRRQQPTTEEGGEGVSNEAFTECM